jgi:hypothetical protein
VLRDAAGGGATEFDFGRSSEGTGTYQFKKQWGALAEPLHWTSYDRERRPRSEGAYLSAGRNERLARAWSRLPLVVSRRLGPVLRKRLPN